MRGLLLQLPCAALVAGALAGAACDGGGRGYVEREEKRFSLSTADKPDLTLGTFDGSIDVHASEGPDLLVTMEKRALNKDAASAIEFRTTQDGSRITVDVQIPLASGLWFLGWNWGSARLIVATPAASDIHARTGDGAITVDGITGKIELRTGDGGIQGRGLSGDIDVRTGDGSINLEATNGRLDAITGDGSIRVAGKLRGLRVRTGDGGVAIRLAPESVVAEDWSIKTGDGSIALELPNEFGAELDARTGDGGINLSGITIAEVSGRIGTHRLRGRLGSGGRTLYVHTGDGSINLSRSPTGPDTH